MEQLNPGPGYEEAPGQPANHDHLHYSEVHFSKNRRDPLNSTVQQDPPQEEDHVSYAVVHFRPNATPE
ncbi:hypothetical protein Q5P01_025570 [Channa striata]|uniref:Uncharacterized protein n=1 Tax=Channa striata TaxID=64152 RepID=A0AA88LIB2_CHASR|nr:hypothetical protein Q5P01_025570 [Channa striata]